MSATVMINGDVDTSGVDENKFKRTAMTKSAVPNVTKLSRQAHTPRRLRCEQQQQEVQAWRMSTVLQRLPRRGKTLLIPVGIP
jgi:hypothetical protein